MKVIKSALLCLLVSVFCFSCSKDNEEKHEIKGLWVGKYGSGTTTYPTAGYAFLFRGDGTVRVFDGADTSALSASSKAEGTYTVSGTTVTTTYIYGTSNKFSTSATVDAKFTFIEGTWGAGTSTTSGGKFFLNKK